MIHLKLRNQYGWIFIDSLIGVVIVATALVALIAMYTQATKNSVFNREYNNAVFVAQQALENIKQDEGKEAIANEPNPSNRTIDKMEYKITVERITVSGTLNSRIYPYEVTVSWPAAKPTNSVKIAAYYLSN